MERAEDFVVLEVEGPRQLKVALEDGQGRRLDDKVLWRSCGQVAEGLVVLGSRDPRSPP